ncbi:DUF2357 domain-containing protein [Melghirimyces algeriensis]|uniref:PD-(D/E)XK nuclease superfamily protein n=1 Tax=Melghirimyces algeriensis TaxID=910412 RepID=A0A521E073_9BACL|nr:DUF2357 domain-containing protein [Melghirimyces algeriensis]SMO77357.1 PD-(D/E)XK nuclease superfamily protein [Melghirimyces algeriensis]
MDIPFEIHFEQKGHQQTLDRFFTDETDFYKHTGALIQLTENIPLTVIFHSNDPSVRFYMDGLDSLPETTVKTDPEGGIYLSPSPYPVTLFDPRDDVYPFIPGYYRIRISTHQQSYYAGLRILPKQIQVSQLEQMREEVEHVLQGLALNWYRKNMVNRPMAMDTTVPPKLMLQSMMIQRHFPKAISALNDLREKIHYRVQKAYKNLPVERCKVIDNVTVKQHLTQPANTMTLKTPYRVIDVDLPENRLLKHITRSITRMLHQFNDSADQYRKKINDELGSFSENSTIVRQKQNVLKDLNDTLRQAHKLKRSFQRIQSAPWYSNISDTWSVNVSHVMNSDARYRAIYQLYREWKQKDITITLDESLQYQWKRTDKLYEIWSMIQLIQLLSREPLGYRPVSGWMVHSVMNNGTMHIPSLPAGEKIVFEKEEIRLHLTYDGTVPTNSKQTTLYGTPVYTRGTNNRPDARLDIYKRGTYIGGQVMDFKYRPKIAVWNPNRIGNNRQTDTMRQLNSYGSDFRSPFLYTPDWKWRQAIREVWALYPEQHPKESVDYIEDHSICLLSLSPGFHNRHVAKRLQQVIDQLVKEYDAFCGKSNNP